jgi:hypothetical protein
VISLWQSHHFLLFHSAFPLFYGIIMTHTFYHILHIVGLALVFSGFGALISKEPCKCSMRLHGLGLLISLISGFGMLAKMGIMKSMPPWVWIKLGLWLVLGFLPVLAKRQVLPSRVVLMIALVIGAVLAYLGYTKPAFG